MLVNKDPISKFLPKETTYSLKGICMVMIIMCHTYIHWQITNPPGFMEYLYIRKWGEWGSGLFLFLSGYGLFLSINKSERGEITYSYIWEKLKKLITPFIYVWVVYLLLFLLFDREKIKLELLSYFFTFAVPYAETWFFRVIVSLYILVYITFKFCKKNVLSVGIIVLLCSCYYLYVSKYSGLGRWWYNSIMCFPLGMIIAYFRTTISKINPLAITLLLQILFILVILYTKSDMLWCMSFSLAILFLCNFISLNIYIFNWVGTNSLFFYLLESPSKIYFSSFFTWNYFMFIFITLVVISTLILIYKKLQSLSIIK